MNFWKFWAAFLPLIAISLATIGFLARDRLAMTPPRPELPIPGRRFVSEYSGAGATAAHDIYFHGLFGFDQRIRDSNLFLIGSSHVEFGLSARQASALLSRDGPPVRGFNLGVGCAEAVQFGFDALAHNGVSGGLAVVDAFTLESNLSYCGEQSEKHDLVQAYFSVLKVWAKALYDWSLDPALPRIVFAPEGPRVQRFMSGLLIEQDWQSGDAVFVWHPDVGVQYPHFALPVLDIAEKSRALGIDWDLDKRLIIVPDAILQQATALELGLAVTFVPWVPHRPGDSDWYKRVISRIVSTPAANTRCFADIPVADLSSWDGGMHLTGEAKATATERLVANLSAHGCLTGAAPAP